jgi:hypothetical protein
VFRLELRLHTVLSGVLGMKDYLTCPKRGCSGGGWVTASQSTAQCPQCNTCFPVGSKGLISMSEQRSEWWKRWHCQSCPTCNAPIQKNGGCPWVSCARCSTLFCFICRRPNGVRHNHALCASRNGARQLFAFLLTKWREVVLGAVALYALKRAVARAVAALRARIDASPALTRMAHALSRAAYVWRQVTVRFCVCV